MVSHIPQQSAYDPNTFAVEKQSKSLWCCLKKKKEIPRRKSLKIYPELVIGEDIEDWARRQILNIEREKK
jgi:hypothetical protein